MCMHLYTYKIRCANIALERLVLLSVSMWTIFTRTNTTLSQKSLTQNEVESKRNILAYTFATSSISDLGSVKNMLADVIVDHDIV